MPQKQKNEDEILILFRNFVRKYKSAETIDEKIDLSTLINSLSLATSISDEQGAQSRMLKEIRILYNSIKGNKNE